MRISDWSSDVCSSDLGLLLLSAPRLLGRRLRGLLAAPCLAAFGAAPQRVHQADDLLLLRPRRRLDLAPLHLRPDQLGQRSEEHTSELQSLMRISYAVFCLKTKTKKNETRVTHI